ncbi:MAG: hypothetical protein HQL59_09800 [Magnetococcales bacterium]|nr:hypothetical protein [Magnetococcales bacterium]
MSTRLSPTYTLVQDQRPDGRHAESVFGWPMRVLFLLLNPSWWGTIWMVSQNRLRYGKALATASVRKRLFPALAPGQAH